MGSFFFSLINIPTSFIHTSPCYLHVYCCIEKKNTHQQKALPFLFCGLSFLTTIKTSEISFTCNLYSITASIARSQKTASKHSLLAIAIYIYQLVLFFVKTKLHTDSKSVTPSNLCTWLWSPHTYITQHHKERNHILSSNIRELCIHTDNFFFVSLYTWVILCISVYQFTNCTY